MDNRLNIESTTSVTESGGGSSSSEAVPMPSPVTKTAKCVLFDTRSTTHAHNKKVQSGNGGVLYCLHYVLTLLYRDIYIQSILLGSLLERQYVLWWRSASGFIYRRRQSIAFLLLFFSLAHDIRSQHHRITGRAQEWWKSFVIRPNISGVIGTIPSFERWSEGSLTTWSQGKKCGRRKPDWVVGRRIAFHKSDACNWTHSSSPSITLDRVYIKKIFFSMNKTRKSIWTRDMARTEL